MLSGYCEIIMLNRPAAYRTADLKKLTFHCLNIKLNVLLILALLGS